MQRNEATMNQLAAPQRGREWFRQRGLAWGRLLLLAIAVALGTAAYRDHLNPHLPWWQWLVELVAGCALLTVAFRDVGPAVEGIARRWARRVIGLGALLSGAAAITLIPQPGRELEAGVAVVLTVFAFLAVRWVPFASVDVECLTDTSPPPPARIGIRIRQLGLAAFGIAASIAATHCNPTQHLAAFLLWLTSMILFAAAMWRRTPLTHPKCVWDAQGGPLLSARSTALTLLLILLLAAALRMASLIEVPAWIHEDEGRQGRYSERIWQDGFPDAFGLGWNAFPHLAFMADYVGVQLLGTSNQNLRLATASIGVLSLIPLFFWAQRWWGNGIALLAVFLLAINREHIAWSRTALNNIQQVLVAGLMLATFARVLRTQRAIDWVWLGYATGLAFHTYHAAKLFPALLAVVATLFTVGIRDLLRRSVSGVLIGAIACLLCLGPLIVTTYEHWDYFYANVSNRGAVHFVSAAYSAGNTLEVRNLLRSHVAGCLQAFTTLPMARLAIFDPFVAVPFLLGAGWMLWRWRDPRHTTVLVWTIGILVVAGMMTDYPPAKARLLGFLPTICVIPAIVAGRIRAALFRCSPVRADLIAAPLLVLWLGAALHYNWYTEFVFRPQRERGVMLTEICRAIERVPLPATLYMAGGEVMGEPKVAANDCMIAPNPDRVMVNLPDDPAIVPIPPTNRGNAVLLVSRHQAELLPRVRDHYPEAHYRLVHDQLGVPILHIFTVDSRVIEQHRGLRAIYRTPTGVITSSAGTQLLAPPAGSEFPVTASWRGQLWMPTPGAYAFRIGGAVFHLNGIPIAPDEPHQLAAGWHGVVVGATFRQATDHVTLQWRPPGAAQFVAIPRASVHDRTEAPGLLGRYFSRVIETTSSAPIAAVPDYTRIEPAISFDWYLQFDEPPPAPFAARPSTMEWVGTVDLPAGPFQRLQVVSTTPAQVFLNDTLVVKTAGSAAGQTVEANVVDMTGRVPILVRATRGADDQWGMWKLRLLWSTPGGAWTAVASYRPDPF